MGGTNNKNLKESYGFIAVGNVCAGSEGSQEQMKCILKVTYTAEHVHRNELRRGER